LDACFSSDVPQLLANCTNLRSLTLKVEQIPHRFSSSDSLDYEENLQRQHFSSTFCQQLRKFSLDINDLTLIDVKYFLFNMPNLHYLSLQGLSYDIDFSSGELWLKILENRTKHLKEFQLKTLRIWLANRIDIGEHANEYLCQINSSFTSWTRRWSIEQNHELRPNHLNLILYAKTI